MYTIQAHSSFFGVVLVSSLPEDRRRHKQFRLKYLRQPAFRFRCLCVRGPCHSVNNAVDEDLERRRCATQTITSYHEPFAHGNFKRRSLLGFDLSNVDLDFAGIGKLDFLRGALEEILDEKGITPSVLAVRADLAEKTVRQIVHGVAPITYDTAEKFELALNAPAHFWNRRELAYREALARM